MRPLHRPTGSLSAKMPARTRTARTIITAMLIAAGSSPVASQMAANVGDAASTNCVDLAIDGMPWEDASGYDCEVSLLGCT